MKKLFIIFLLIAACTPAAPPEPEPDSPYKDSIIGMWEKEDKFQKYTLTIKPENKCSYTSLWKIPPTAELEKPFTIKYDYLLKGNEFSYGYSDKVYEITSLNEKELVLTVKRLTKTEADWKKYYEDKRPTMPSLGTFEDYKKTQLEKIGQVETWKKLM